MNNLARIRVTAAAETVIKKLSKAQIPLYGLKKQGAYTTFLVKDKTVKKVFAIFSHPCYNVCVIQYGALRSLLRRAAARVGLLVGALVFAVVVTCAQAFVFKVQVVGSGAYLSPQVTAILCDSGIAVGKLYKDVDKPLTIAKIMALPSVTFCSFEKRGTAVIVDVECDEEGSISSTRTPLVSPVSGEVVNITVICGTPRVQEGQAVSRGDELISPFYTDGEGQTVGCLCVGYVDIRVSAVISVSAQSEGEEGLSSALAAVNLYSDEAQITSYSVKTVAEGVIYTVNFTYIHTASINMQ